MTNFRGHHVTLPAVGLVALAFVCLTVFLLAGSSAPAPPPAPSQVAVASTATDTPTPSPSPSPDITASPSPTKPPATTYPIVTSCDPSSVPWAIPVQTPAVDVSAITYEVRKGFFGTSEALEALKRSITSLVEYRARENTPLVREMARRQTETFVARWLASRFSDGGNYVVRVTFADESPATLPAPLLPSRRE